VRLLRLVVMASVVFGGASLSEAQTSTEGVSSASRPPNTQRFAGMTRAAMMRAKELPLPNVDPQKVRAAFDKTKRAGKPATPGESESADLGNASEKASGNVKSRPLYWAGKLFFKKPDGTYVCSAQFISKNVIVTAAHCVRDPDTGEFYDNLVFALQYNKGKYSKRYSYRCVATNNAWVQPEPDRYLSDYAMILVDGESPTGYFGVEWNWGKYKDGTKIGYPGGIEDGEVIQVDKGPLSLIDGLVEMKHGNEADQGGSSGGAWVAKYTNAKDKKSNYIISVESFGFEGIPGIDYGPYLDDNFKGLWDYVANDCKEP
jgi:hypothetical protein